MHDTSYEKSMAFALTFSFFLHVGLFLLLMLMPQPKQKPAQDPIMVDLQDLPVLSRPTVKNETKVKRHAETPQRVPQESAPRGEREKDKPGQLSEMRPVRPQPPPPQKPVEPKQARIPDEGIFKPKPRESVDVAKLYPSAGRLAKIEEGYRRKYSEEVKESDTKFLNTDDIFFGSFLRRFESAVYGVWRYPAEAVKLGIEGVTPVRITFNRKGEVEKVEVLETSGSKILDEEVRRTLKQIGPVGSLPKGYDKETFHLIAFFHYGIASGSVRGRLY